MPACTRAARTRGDAVGRAEGQLHDGVGHQQRARGLVEEGDLRVEPRNRKLGCRQHLLLELVSPGRAAVVVLEHAGGEDAEELYWEVQRK